MIIKMAADDDQTLGYQRWPAMAQSKIDMAHACADAWLPWGTPYQPSPFRDSNSFRQPDRVDTRAVEQFVAGLSSAARCVVGSALGVDMCSCRSP